jgi:hypothetical protein
VQSLSRELLREDRLSLALIGPYADSDPFEKLLTLPDNQG